MISVRFSDGKIVDLRSAGDDINAAHAIIAQKKPGIKRTEYDLSQDGKVVHSGSATAEKAAGLRKEASDIMTDYEASKETPVSTALFPFSTAAYDQELPSVASDVLQQGAAGAADVLTLPFRAAAGAWEGAWAPEGQGTEALKREMASPGDFTGDPGVGLSLTLPDPSRGVKLLKNVPKVGATVTKAEKAGQKLLKKGGEVAEKAPIQKAKKIIDKIPVVRNLPAAARMGTPGLFLDAAMAPIDYAYSVGGDVIRQMATGSPLELRDPAQILESAQANPIIGGALRLGGKALKGVGNKILQSQFLKGEAKLRDRMAGENLGELLTKGTEEMPAPYQGLRMTTGQADAQVKENLANISKARTEQVLASAHPQDLEMIQKAASGIKLTTRDVSDELGTMYEGYVDEKQLMKITDKANELFEDVIKRRGTGDIAVQDFMRAYTELGKDIPWDKLRNPGRFGMPSSKDLSRAMVYKHLGGIIDVMTASKSKPGLFSPEVSFPVQTALIQAGISPGSVLNMPDPTSGVYSAFNPAFTKQLRNQDLINAYMDRTGKNNILGLTDLFALGGAGSVGAFTHDPMTAIPAAMAGLGISKGLTTPGGGAAIYKGGELLGNLYRPAQRLRAQQDYFTSED